MAIKMPAQINTQLNMTPMIDIVFQLILFFLFNLRFKSMDYRIESALPDSLGLRRIQTIVPQKPRIKVTLSRRDAEDLDKARTRVKVGAQEWILPGLSASAAERDAALAAVGARIAALRAETGWPGEIDTPPPTGGLVPHADVVGVLDTFLGVGVTDVQFQGATMPKPGR